MPDAIQDPATSAPAVGSGPGPTPADTLGRAPGPVTRETLGPTPGWKPEAAPAAPARSGAPRALVAASVLGWFFLGAGVMRLLPVPFDVALFESWGLPAWFRAGVGLGELTVGALTLSHRTRPVGAVGIGTVMVSAGTMHAALGHSLVIAVAVNGTLAAAAFATAWALRAQLR